MASPIPPPLPGSTPAGSPGHDPGPDVDVAQDLQEAVEALAAGELSPSAAEALQARLDAPGGERLAALYAEARRVEAALRAEALLPLPLNVVSGTLARIRGQRRVPATVLFARAAACVLIFFTSWIVFAGEVPTLEQVTAHPRLVASLEGTPLPAPPPVREVFADAAGVHLTSVSGGTALSLGLGLLLFVGGVWFAFSSHRRAAAAAIRGGDA